METDEVVADLQKQYPRGQVRVLDDGSIAIIDDLLTTRSVILGVDDWTWARRFCFSTRHLADEFFNSLKSADDVPNGGYVARRPEYEDRADPYLNELHRRPWNKEFE